MEGERRLVKLALVSVFFVIQSVLAQQIPSRIERSALLNLRSSLGLRGKDWPIKSNPCSSWAGIRCESGRVIGINISGLRRTRAGRGNARFAVDSLSNLTSLVSFNASGFSLPGYIPDWFGQSLIALQVLDLSSASIIGPVPTSIGGLKKLNALYLSGNSLTGIITSSLGQLSELSILDLSRNSLTGSIPSAFSSLTNLTLLELSSNFLTGQIPPGLGSLPKLQFLNLSDNSFTSSIPVQLSNLSGLLYLNLSKNSLSGSIPVGLSELRNLNTMDFGDNILEGPLPVSLFSSLPQLQVLVLRGNKLDGILPRQLFSFHSLRFLDVSTNNFTGEIPIVDSGSNVSGAVFNFSNNMFYGYLNFSLELYSLIDLSGNFFQGNVSLNTTSKASIRGNCLEKVVPDQRSLADCRLFYSARGLTFDDGGQELSDQPSGEVLSERSNRLKFILIGVFGGIAFIILLVFVLVLLLRFCDKGIVNQRVNANVGPVPEGQNPSSLHKDHVYLTGLGDSYTYKQVLNSTGNFSETTLIKHGHSGDLYQGLSEGGIPVVIKKVDLGSAKKESYMQELYFFSKVSHSRLVPVLGHCLDQENEKFIVYKYMPNGDLANCLHKVTSLEDNDLKSLDWITRLKIAIGAAEGLAYLHHECSPPYVHRDVQASSILLDDKFEVRLGSLSEVCVQEGDYNHNVLTRLLRKPQTTEQGPSGSSTESCAHDVYCFGKVLLELVTGKLGFSKPEESTTTREWLDNTLPCISIYDQELMNKIVDPSLIIDEDLLKEVWAMAVVAKSCLNPRPSRRPLMRQILKALENPLKVVREESASSARLHSTSSRVPWSAAFLGSWRHNSSENAAVSGSGLRQPVRIGSHGSCGNDFSASRKRLSNEIFPETEEMQDVERQD